ncbi:CPBP family intramembrane glutamic endopeptidase [Streptomyces huiliensis]|uniref:CPBP family intramembrane glutamic endopeptidase n=1 Tax=Streptomyces huiliensis TaxID=2876027 RepID=UPI001CBA9CAF|nr:CPBP family intramembrane glutamic endopeptidase [Streptomyces huiliensis]MBZ4318972.1 CPBP family intramembrane metalloprotease [Streptomyces huiliensis]
MTISTGAEPLSGRTPWAARRRDVVLYLGVAYAGMWLAMLPLLVAGYRRGDAREGTGLLEELCIGAAMFAPALGAVVAVRYVRGGGGGVGRVREALALRWPRPWGRAVRECLTAVAVPAGLTAAALALGALAGRYPVGEVGLGDVTGWAAGGLVGMVLSLPLFFGEELGWQGYLFPRLLRGDGRTRPLRAYLLTGAAFALWHLPMLLMGGQYPGRSWYVSVPAMVVSCTLVLPVLTWLRLRSGSVVPAVVAHAFVSSLGVGMVKRFAAPGAALDPLHMGLTGWPGWIVLAAFVAFLARTGRLRPVDGTRTGAGAGARTDASGPAVLDRF